MESDLQIMDVTLRTEALGLVLDVPGVSNYPVALSEAQLVSVLLRILCIAQYDDTAFVVLGSVVGAATVGVQQAIHAEVRVFVRIARLLA